MTPQLARRVTIVGSLALMMFAIIFFRLWFLQVLSGTQYAKAATVNYVRYITIAAPRGEILDSAGNVLVNSQPVNAVEIEPDALPVPVTLANIVDQPARDYVVYDRLAKVLQLSTKPGACAIVAHGTQQLAPIPCMVAQQVELLPFAPVTIDTDVSNYVLYYWAERQTEFPGVEVPQVSLRQYPYGTLAAQVLGTVGPISKAELNDKQRFKGVNRQAVVGQSGLEWQYQQYLQGVNGEAKVRVNSFNQFEGDLPTHAPIDGDNLRTSLNTQLQKVGEAALAQSIASNPPATGGAFVAMNPDSGEVYAMGSAPTFPPAIFTKPISVPAYKALLNPSGGFPLVNRATDSQGPTGSTFKVITATAALESGAWSVGDTYDDTGQFCIDTECRRNAGGAAYGLLDLVNAIRVSSDVFFYNLGAKLNVDPVGHPGGGALQQWAKKLGIGQPTGIDLPAADTGTLPTPGWRAHQNLLEQECENATGPYAYTNGKSVGPVKLKGWYRSPKHPAANGVGCGIAIVPPETWTVGDNINMAVGQGDVQVTPLQLAVVYSALANGGTIVRPHLGLDIQTSDGTVLQKLVPPAAGHINIDPTYLDTIRAGLRAAASQSGGTSYDVMGNFPEQVYGKTGTAQYNGQQDYAWYACFVPATATTKPILVVVTVEQGGFGDVAAAPVARQILSQWFFGKPGPYAAGSSHSL
jgi:penicillin-binding protein 2